MRDQFSHLFISFDLGVTGKLSKSSIEFTGGALPVGARGVLSVPEVLVELP